MNDSLKQMVNIPRTIQDSNYRYQMPLLQQMKIGKGINERTKLLNLEEIAKALYIEVQTIAKYFSQILGTNVNVETDKKSNEIITIEVKGVYPEEDTRNCLDQFINEFILCQKCKVPEMNLLVQEDELVGLCNACGFLSKMNPTHKLTKYLLKNPPKMLRDIKQRKQGNENEENKKELPSHLLKYPARELLRIFLDNPYQENNQLFVQLKELYFDQIIPVKEGYAFDDSDTEVLYKLLKQLRIQKDKIPLTGTVLFNILFDQNLIKQIDSRGILFEEVLKRHQLERVKCPEVILCICYLIFFRFSQLNFEKQIPTILMKFFQLELITEEFILGWKNKDSSIMSFMQMHPIFKEEYDNKLRDLAKPFLDWVEQNAEEESEEEDSQDQSNEEDQQFTQKNI